MARVHIIAAVSLLEFDRIDWFENLDIDWVVLGILAVFPKQIRTSCDHRQYNSVRLDGKSKAAALESDHAIALAAGAFRENEESRHFARLERLLDNRGATALFTVDKDTTELMHPEVQNRDALQLRLGDKANSTLQSEERKRDIQVRTMVTHHEHRARPVHFCQLRLVFNRQIHAQDLHAEAGFVQAMDPSLCDGKCT